MSTVTIHNQNLLDIAIQVSGKPENFLKIAKANNLELTGTIPAGTKLIIPDDLDTDDDVLKYYRANDIKPATDVYGINNKEFKGIGAMEIENTFRVR